MSIFRAASLPRACCVSLAAALFLGACANEPHSFLDASRGDASLDGGDGAVTPADVREIEVTPRDARLDPDATCATGAAMSEVTRLPVDIIWVVDNSSSMQPAIEQVTAGLNNFANLVGMRGLDYHVIMLSLRSMTNPTTHNGDRRFGVCIPQPLAGDARCGNGERFLQSSVDIKSTQPLEQLLGTLGQTTGYTMGEERGGEPWRSFLRDDATKTIVVVTDDNSRFTADQFERFRGGTNPATSRVMLPPGILDASWSGLFENYTFNAIYGYGSTDTMRCTFDDGTMPSSHGPVYTTLVDRTSGVRARLCDGAAAWGPFFESIATAVVRSSRISCDVSLPRPPDGSALDPALVNVTLTGSTPRTLGKVSGPAACGAAGGWHYDDERNPTRIVLCPSSCETAQEALRDDGGGVQVQFGCQSVPG